MELFITQQKYTKSYTRKFYTRPPVSRYAGFRNQFMCVWGEVRPSRRVHVGRVLYMDFSLLHTWLQLLLIAVVGELLELEHFDSIVLYCQ